MNKNNANFLKCINCGSTSYEEIGHNKYKCKYCKSEFKNEFEDDNTEEMEEFNKKKNAEAKLYLVEPVLNKNDFIKKAIISLGMNIDVPVDVLDSIYFNADTEYTQLISYDIEARSTTRFEENYNQPISKEITSATMVNSPVDPNINIVHEIENIKFRGNYKPLTKKALQDKDIKVLSQGEIDYLIQNNIENINNELEEEFPDTQFMYRTEYLRVYLCPLYKLNFDYQGEQYLIGCISSNENIIGTKPTNNESQNVLSKARKPWNIVVYIIIAITLLFPLIHAMFIKTQGLKTLDYISAAIAAVTLSVDNLIDKICTNKAKAKILEERKRIVISKLNSLGISYDDNEIKEGL